MSAKRRLEAGLEAEIREVLEANAQAGGPRVVERPRLGSTQRLVLDNVAARRAPYAGHKTYAEYTRRMSVARELEKRGMLISLPFGHPENAGLSSTYRLTASGAAARLDPKMTSDR